LSRSSRYPVAAPPHAIVASPRERHASIDASFRRSSTRDALVREDTPRATRESSRCGDASRGADVATRRRRARRIGFGAGLYL